MAFLERVTVTGADDGTDPNELLRLSERYPFVEWGILLSKSQEGNARFPSETWIRKLRETRIEAIGKSMVLSGHLCGSWVRELCLGRLKFLDDRPVLGRMFDRVQLNFHALAHTISQPAFSKALKDWNVGEYIFQFDNTNNWVLSSALTDGINAVPLFDTSGGAGIEPSSWARPFGAKSGYAGGLHPDKIEGQLDRIMAAAEHNKIWIDVETHVRSDDDKLFDLDKVTKFLATVAPKVGRWL